LSLAPGPVPFQSPEPQREALKVFVRGLRVEAGIGVHDHEQGRLQPLVIDVELTLAPGDVERLSDTINYEAVAEAARAIVASGHVGLVETFADRLALACLEDPMVQGVKVRVEKPGALPDTVAPGCEVVWRR
jgi:7,8-dihydroneopterin aldolase/epimerase/oxygenase